MKIIVGLGNIGKKYEKTYHNMGFMVINKIAEILKVKVKDKACSSLIKALSVGGEQTVLAKPTTLMNNSGEAVNSLLKRFNATISDLIVIYDDIDLPRFDLRCRREGGAGTHNGMKSIINSIESKAFTRIRIGIGCDTEQELHKYVLSKRKKADDKAFDDVFTKIAQALIDYTKSNDIDMLMRNINEK